MNAEQSDVLNQLYSKAQEKAYLAEPDTDEETFYEGIAKGYGKALDALYILDGASVEDTKDLTGYEVDIIKNQ